MQHIGDTIRIWTDETERLSRKQIAEAAGVVVQQVGRWIAGEQEPDLASCQRMASSASDLPEQLKREIAAWMLRPTPFQPQPTEKHGRAALDTNGDNRIDAKDVVSHALQAIAAATAAAAQLKQAVCEGHAQEPDRDKARQTLQESRQAIDLALEALDFETWPTSAGRGSNGHSGGSRG